jgi:CDP-glycerol glycerophosphotransferase (TagB/SpsB family)
MINFNLTSSNNYHLVQSQINGLIQRHLPAGSWSESEGYVPGKLNFTLFIDNEAEVLMSHGAADKSYHWKRDKEGLRLNHHRRRSHLLVPGEFLAQRISSSGGLHFKAPRQVHVVGWPRLDLLLDLARKPSIFRFSWFGKRRRRVLWAPTHDYSKKGQKKVSLSSYPDFEPYIQELEKYYDVAVALHPRNRKDKAPTDTLLLWADVVISDFGTLVYEAWALGKQVIFPDWLIRDKLVKYLPHAAEGRIFAESIGLHAGGFEEMCDMIAENSPLDEKSRQFIEHYLEPDYHGCSAKRAADLLLELAESGSRPPGRSRRPDYPNGKQEDK